MTRNLDGGSVKSLLVDCVTHVQVSSCNRLVWPTFCCYWNVIQSERNYNNIAVLRNYYSDVDLTLNVLLFPETSNRYSNQLLKK